MAGADRLSPRVVAWMVAGTAFVLLLALGWQFSDANAVDRLAVGTAPPVDTGAVADTVAPAWTAGNRASTGASVESGTVILREFDGVSGLDPVTGEQRWHYYRVGDSLCDAAAADGVVVTVFRSGGRCDEAATFDAATGRRLWYRSVNLSPDVALTATDGLSVAWNATGVATFGTLSNGLRWRYRPPTDCRIDDVRAGDVGVGVVLACPTASRLVLLDGFQGDTRWSWELPTGGGEVLTADGVVVVVSTDLAGSVTVLDYAGALKMTVRDSTLAPDVLLDHQEAVLVGDTVVVWTGSQVHGLPTGQDTVAWSAAALSPPVAPDKAGGDALAVATATGFAELDPDTGAVRRSITGSEVGGPGRLYRVGATLILTAGSGARGFR